MKHKQEPLPVKRRLIKRTLTGCAPVVNLVLLQLQVHRLCPALRSCQPAPRSRRVGGRRPQNTDGPSLALARALLPASTAQLPAGGFRSDSAITVSCSPAPACSSSANFSHHAPPVSSEPQLWQGASLSFRGFSVSSLEVVAAPFFRYSCVPWSPVDPS